MQSARFSAFAITLSASALFAGCSGSSSVNQAAGAGSANLAGATVSSAGAFGDPSGGGAFTVGGGGAGVTLEVTDDPAGSTSLGGSASDPYPDTLPDGFTAANVFGGYRLGAPITAAEDSSSDLSGDKLDGCGTTILAVIRDFKRDGENFEGPDISDDRGLVEPILGADRKPVLASSKPTVTVKDPAQFADWYRTVDGLNKAYKFELWFAPNAGVSSFQSTEFFPLDGKGWDEGESYHNYHFTTEIHTRFKYQGGESFKFTGDDDVWVFINDKLAIDLGGVHGPESASIDIDARADELGLQKGKVYSFDMFQNERHTAESNFRADTNLNFVDCGTIVPEVPK